MKKLKIKVFFVTFGILSIIVISLFIINNTRNYLFIKKDIETILTRNIVDNAFINKRRNNIPDNGPQKVFLDYDVYTIILKKNGKYLDVINHAENNINKTELETLTNKIVNNSNSGYYYIGNLFTNKYSYSYLTNNSITIVDNTNTNKKLVSSLLYSLFFLVIIEGILYFIADRLTKWIIDPVNESFERQKRFIADASHELKTPLAVMITSSDAYYKDGKKKWIDNMRSESERMTSLVTNLLDISEIENDGNNNFKNEDISEMIENTILTNECLFFESNIELEYNIDKKIEMNCDKNQLKQLITILLDNALKHSKKEGKVIVKLYQDNKNIILKVKNKGLPIPEGEEEKIFERFYKSDKSRNRDDNSYGLGLSIAKTIVDNHEGSIIATREGSYTTFIVKWNQ